MAIKKYDAILDKLPADQLNDVYFLMKFYNCNNIDLSKKGLITIEMLTPNPPPMLVRIFPELAMNMTLTIKGQWIVFRNRNR